MQRNNHLFSSAPDTRRDATGAVQQQRRCTRRPSQLAPRIILRLALLLLLPALLWLATPQGAHAQATPLSGTKTVCPVGGDYASLTAAIGAINSLGLDGPLTLELCSSYTSSGETFPLTFPAFPGSSATNTVQNHQ